MRIIIATVGTVLWAFVGWLYVVDFVGWENFQNYNPNEVGQFLIGMVAPLVFFWLLVGYFQLGAELRNNAEALLEQGDELRRFAELIDHQARGSQASQQYIRRESFMRFAELTLRDLHTIATEITLDMATKTLRERTRDSFEGGDKDAYFSLIIRSFYNQDLNKVVRFLGRARNFPNNIGVFQRKFDRLIEEADACEPDGALRDHFESAAVGRLNEIFRDVQQVLGEETEVATGDAGDAGEGVEEDAYVDDADHV